MKYEYPMWFKSKATGIIVKFDGLCSGGVVARDPYEEVGFYSEEWYSHEEEAWVDVTDQYKGKEMENSAIEINTSHTPMEELQQIILNGKMYNLVPVEDTKPVEPTIEKWEPKGGEWFIDSDGEALTDDSLDSYRLYGSERETKAQAQKASIEMRKHNRLLAWLAENDDGWVADWTNSDSKYYVAYAHDRGKYEVYDNYATEPLTLVFMSEDNAYKLADLLNKGIVEL